MCIRDRYGPTIDADTGIEGQQLSGADTVVVIEQWESVAALKDHLVAEHMNAFRESVKDLVADIQLEVYQTA